MNLNNHILNISLSVMAQRFARWQVNCRWETRSSSGMGISHRSARYKNGRATAVLKQSCTLLLNAFVSEDSKIHFGRLDLWQLVWESMPNKKSELVKKSLRGVSLLNLISGATSLCTIPFSGKQKCVCKSQQLKGTLQRERRSTKNAGLRRAEAHPKNFPRTPYHRSQHQIMALSSTDEKFKHTEDFQYFPPARGGGESFPPMEWPRIVPRPQLFTT